jgi:hypothetical protein
MELWVECFTLLFLPGNDFLRIQGGGRRKAILGSFSLKISMIALLETPSEDVWVILDALGFGFAGDSERVRFPEGSLPFSDPFPSFSSSDSSPGASDKSASSVFFSVRVVIFSSHSLVASERTSRYF